jgi:hypothetical protein
MSIGSEISRKKIPDKYKDAEAVIFTAYPFDQNWIGENTGLSLSSSSGDQ